MYIQLRTLIVTCLAETYDNVTFSHCGFYILARMQTPQADAYIYIIVIQFALHQRILNANKHPRSSMLGVITELPRGADQYMVTWRSFFLFSLLMHLTSLKILYCTEMKYYLVTGKPKRWIRFWQSGIPMSEPHTSRINFDILIVLILFELITGVII